MLTFNRQSLEKMDTKMDTKINSLPIVDDDIIFKLDSNDKKIKLGTTLIGEINHLPSSESTEDGEIYVMWHSNYDKQRLPANEAYVLENRCEIGMGVCSLVDQEKYGICVKKRTLATCVVLDEDTKERKYLLNVDSSRLKSFSDINYDLCFFKNGIFEVSDINYAIKLNYMDKLIVNICSTKRFFMKRFFLVGDRYNKNFPKYDKPIELSFVNKCPLSFNEIIGKQVKIKGSEILKFKNNLELMQWLELFNLAVDEIKEKDTDLNETQTIDDLMNESNDLNKDNESKIAPINDYFTPNRRFSESSSMNKDRSLQFTVEDVQIHEVILNCIKDFLGSPSVDHDFKTEKIGSDQLEKLKFFRINDRNVELGCRMKLELNDEDELVDFNEYKHHLNSSVKDKIKSLSKRSNLNIDDYEVETNNCYEKEKTIVKQDTILLNGKEDKIIWQTNSKSDHSLVIVDVDRIVEDDVFFDNSASQLINNINDKSMTKEDLRNQHLRMLSRSNRRSRNGSSRGNNSMQTRQSTNERLMNSSFKKVKLFSQANEDNDDHDTAISKKNELNDQKKNVLVDVLYTDTFVDIHWQDNTVETNIPLSKISEEIDTLIQKYYPGNFVDFTCDMVNSTDSVPNYGVIQKVNQSQSTATIKWFLENANDNDEVNNNSNKCKTWTTYESLFNLHSSYIHHHLNDVVVQSELITNISNATVNDIPKMIGTIREISTEGTALISYIDGTESWKKLVELVSFFDVEFSDYSDDEISFSTRNSNDKSDESADSSLNASDSKQTFFRKFTDINQFNKFKFEFLNDLNTSIDENTFKERWLNKINSLLVFLNEFKDLQFNTIDKLYMDEKKFNYSKDKKISELNFELIDCYFNKIKAHINEFTLKSEQENYLVNFHLQLIFNLNSWLDVIQSNFQNLFTLIEDIVIHYDLGIDFSTLLRSFISGELSENSNDDSADNNLSKIKEDILSLQDDLLGEDKKQAITDYKKKITTLINKFNSEVICQVILDEEMDVSNNDLESTKNSISYLSNDSSISTNSTKFKRLECLSIEDNHIKHKFLKELANIQNESKINLSTLQKELILLRNSLPETGIYFKTFEERLDLMSLMIEGPQDTVYENHIFLFDLKINGNLQEPPECSYLSFGNKQINPNLYPDGNVCLSLLNTFFSKSSVERWQANKSSLLQLALSLQALVLNSNPFFNEADFDVYKETEEGYKKSKSYNEFVIISLIDYSIDIMRKRTNSPFRNEIEKFYQANACKIYDRYYDFLTISMKWNLSGKNKEKLNDKEIEKQFNEMIEKKYPTFKAPSIILLPASARVVQHR